MDFLKISQWLFLFTISSISTSECKAFSKYLVPRNVQDELNKNCFCFKQAGVHQKVPEILNQSKDNLERLVVYLYKDKISNVIKVYIPNEVKQALVPDLAFEVGDKLHKIDNNTKALDIFNNNLYPHVENNKVDTNIPHKINSDHWNNHATFHIDIHKTSPDKTDGIVYDQYQYPDNWQPIHVDSNEASIDIIVPANKDSNKIDMQPLKPQVDAIAPSPSGEHIPTKEVIKPSEAIHTDEQNEPIIEIHKLPSWPVNIPSTQVDIDNNYHHNDDPHYNDKDIPQKVDIFPETVNIDGENKPIIEIHEPVSWSMNKTDEYVNIVNNYHHDGYPHSDDKEQSQEIEIPDETVNIDKQNKPIIEIHELPSWSVNKPSIQVDIDNNYHHNDNPHYNDKDIPQKVDIFPETVNIDVENKPIIEIHEPPSWSINKTDEYVTIDYNSHHNGYPNSNDRGQSQEIEIPNETVNIDGQNKPIIEIHELPPWPVNKPDKYVNIDNNYHHDEYPHNHDKDQSQEIEIPHETVNIKGEKKPIIEIHQLPSWSVIKPGKYVNDGSNHHYNYPHDNDIVPPQKIEIPSGTINIDVKKDDKESIVHVYKEPTVNIPSGGQTSKIYFDINGGQNNHPRKIWYIVNQDAYPSIVDQEKGHQVSVEKISEKENKYSEESANNHIWPGSDAEIAVDKVDSVEHSHNNYETFDRWFIQQMKRFKTYTEHDKAINLETIERYILKILLDNDMHVTTEGVLTDSFGTALDVHNLHLRPILIGNRMPFGNILNDKTKNLVLPANMAYLQAILVTNLNPSLILGIIPVGKTIIPPSAVNAFATVLKPYIYSTWRQPDDPTHHVAQVLPNQRNIKYKTSITYGRGKKPLVLHLTSVTQKPVLSNKTTGKTVVTFVKGPVFVKTDYQRFIRPLKSVNVYGTKSSERSIHSNDSGNQLDKQVISDDKIVPIGSAEATKMLLASLRVADNVKVKGDSGKEEINDEVKVDVEDSEVGDVYEEVDDDDITERIVGGSAATSSGTPLSVKGRIRDD